MTYCTVDHHCVNSTAKNALNHQHAATQHKRLTLHSAQSDQSTDDSKIKINKGETLKTELEKQSDSIHEYIGPRS